MSKSELAVHNFSHGCNCSQAIVATFCEEYNLDKKTMCNLAVAFGGGMGRTGNTCGCLSGALMVIGMKHGENSENDSGIRINTYDKAKQFIAEFTEINGATDCRDIIKLNLSHEEGRRKAQEQNVFSNRCSKIVATTTALLEKI